MKRRSVACVVALVCMLTIPAQADRSAAELQFVQPPDKPGLAGENPVVPFSAGVYLVTPADDALAVSRRPVQAILTFNRDGCTDSTALWDSAAGSSGKNSPAHGIWQRNGDLEVSARLLYLTEDQLGGIDRIGRATLVAVFDRDLEAGRGSIVFESYLPEQLGDGMSPGPDEKPAAMFKMDVHLVGIR